MRLLLNRLEKRIEQLQALDVDGKYEALRDKATEAIAKGRSNLRALDPVTIMALISAIMEIIALIKKMRKA